MENKRKRIRIKLEPTLVYSTYKKIKHNKTASQKPLFCTIVQNELSLKK